MLTRRALGTPLAGAVALGVLVTAFVALLRSPASGRAAVAPSPTAARPTADPVSVATPPPWPSGAPVPPPAAEVASGLVVPQVIVEPGPGFATEPRAIAAKSTAVVDAVAVEQRSYTTDAGMFTATNFRVRRLLRGRVPKVFQLVEAGGPSGSPVAGHQWSPSNYVAPELGHRYLVFLGAALGSGRYPPVQLPTASRLEVVGDMVHALADRHPHADALTLPPRRYAEVIAQLR